MERWIEVLAAECKRTNQTILARKIGYSSSVVSAVLKGNYKGDLRAVKKAVEGALMGAVVQCPVLGELSSNKCLEFQRRDFAASNPMRVMLYRACRSGCPNSRIEQEPR